MRVMIRAFKVRGNRGFSMVEVIITMIIIAGIMTAGILTMRGYVPKQRLASATDYTEKAMSQANYEATSRVFWTCVVHNTTDHMLEVYVDRNSNRECNEGTDFMVATFNLNEHISYADCSGTSDGDPFDDGASAVWFNTSGNPNLCPTPSTCSTQALEFIVVTDQLPSGTRAREVEVNTSGIATIVDRHDTGLNLDTVAKTTQTDGCE